MDTQKSIHKTGSESAEPANILSRENRNTLAFARTTGSCRDSAGVLFPISWNWPIAFLLIPNQSPASPASSSPEERWASGLGPAVANLSLWVLCAWGLLDPESWVSPESYACVLLRNISHLADATEDASDLQGLTVMQNPLLPSS